MVICSCRNISDKGKTIKELKELLEGSDVQCGSCLKSLETEEEIMKHSIKEIIKSGSNAVFKEYRKGIMTYSISVAEDDFAYDYSFQVPLDDIGGATLGLYEKPMMMMRYMRKGLEDQTMTCVKAEYD